MALRSKRVPRAVTVPADVRMRKGCSGAWATAKKARPSSLTSRLAPWLMTWRRERGPSLTAEPSRSVTVETPEGPVTNSSAPNMGSSGRPSMWAPTRKRMSAAATAPPAVASRSHLRRWSVV